jgi:glycosyltransferase involved in cell wall biosynthesis
MKVVSVFMITYNHEKFIGEAIESIVSQDVNFEFELVIGEDCSKDNTRAVCERYAKQYPTIIKLLPSDRNYGPMGNTIRTLEACSGKYIAMCEGDDYWTDKHKLQKQVDFLEANPDFTMCFANVTIKDELGWDWTDEMYYPRCTKNMYTIEDFILSKMNIMPTATVVFRNLLPKPLPEFFRDAVAGDTIIQLLIADKGKAKYLDEKMAVYRNHEGGTTKSKETIERSAASLKKAYENTNKFLGYKYDKIFRERFLEMAKIRLIWGAREKKGMDRLKHYFKFMPDYIKYSKKINLKELIYYHMVLFSPSLLKPLNSASQQSQ